jgi:hypothetical protein
MGPERGLDIVCTWDNGISPLNQYADTTNSYTVCIALLYRRCSYNGMSRKFGAQQVSGKLTTYFIEARACRRGPPATGDRGFESCSLQRGVRCEPDFRGRTAPMTIHIVLLSAINVGAGHVVGCADSSTRYTDNPQCSI